MLDEIKKLNLPSKLPQQSEIDQAKKTLDDALKSFNLTVSFYTTF